MQDEILKSGRDALLVGIPLLILLFIGLFRLDELFLRSKKARTPQPPNGARVRNGPAFHSDPDGKPFPLIRPSK